MARTCSRPATITEASNIPAIRGNKHPQSPNDEDFKPRKRYLDEKTIGETRRSNGDDYPMETTAEFYPKAFDSAEEDEEKNQKVLGYFVTDKADHSNELEKKPMNQFQ
ncbi:Protein of unknown function [Pyronema omphalodes CBS 100304]|uniref:Uncharacterized protein n=1 Tax=Pyronema omphalodes (strain CBS 100304) TaxID=1076935 RepID=U4L0G9_PYROM|nr:Protein of unknown function [Pyronema omphalodes CBS 100304]